MLDRLAIREKLLTDLTYYPSLGLVGARQVGKTTLAKLVAEDISLNSRYLDLQLPSNRQLLTDPEAYLHRYADHLIILDEVQTMPSLFPVLRGLIDEDRRPGRFLLLGSAAPELLRGTAESLAGRISYIELDPLSLSELQPTVDLEQHWLRGGYPSAYLTDDPTRRIRFFDDYLRTFVGTDLRDLAGGTDPEGMRRLLVMLAHNHGTLLNQSQLARSIGVSVTTVQRYQDILSSAFLIRTVRPYLPNLRKRLIKSPKIYLNDSGLVHGLLGIGTYEDLLTHPIVGMSWEGYVAEQISGVLSDNLHLMHYRTAKQDEVDFVLQHPTRGTIAFEVKRSNAPSLSKSFWTAVADLQPSQTYVVSPNVERYPLGKNIEGIGVLDLMEELRSFDR